MAREARCRRQGRKEVCLALQRVERASRSVFSSVRNPLRWCSPAAPLRDGERERPSQAAAKRAHRERAACSLSLVPRTQRPRSSYPCTPASRVQARKRVLTSRRGTSLDPSRVLSGSLTLVRACTVLSRVFAACASVGVEAQRVLRSCRCPGLLSPVVSPSDPASPLHLTTSLSPGPLGTTNDTMQVLRASLLYAIFFPSAGAPSPSCSFLPPSFSTTHCDPAAL